MSIGYSNIAKSYLMVAVDNDDTQLILNNYEGFSRIDADYTYAVMVNATGDKEIVKIDLSNSGVHTRLIASGVTSYSGGLTVARGQGSSTAAAWPRGTLIYIDVTADFLNEIIQKGQFRSVAYNPNGVLSPAYFGEKIYQSDNSRWWKSYNATDPYWALITGSIIYADENWGDSGLGWDVLMPRAWATYFDSTYWNGTWVTVAGGHPFDGWVSTQLGVNYVALTRNGTWWSGLRPTKMRFTLSCQYNPGLNDLELDRVQIPGWGGGTILDSDNIGASVISGQELELDFTAGNDIASLKFIEGGYSVCIVVAKYYVTNIEFYI